jgi:hypothetical protein
MTPTILIGEREYDLLSRYGALLLIAKDRCVPPFVKLKVLEPTRVIPIEWCNESGIGATNGYSYKTAICQQVAGNIL